MKKLIGLFLLAASMSASADNVVTNWVYVISNNVIHTYHENVITQKVKNTHYNYYYTNVLQDVVYRTVFSNFNYSTYTTNLSINCDVSAEAVAAASNHADRAETAADSAASSATAAASSASSASSSASSAAQSRSYAASECSSALATINARIAWFDEHSGEQITVNHYTYNTTTNIYNTEDNTARNMAKANANAITNLQGRATALENRATSLEGRATAVENTAKANANAITNLQSRATAVENTAKANANAITNLLDCVYVSNGKGVYKYLLTGWNSSSFYIYINSTNYTDYSEGTTTTDYRGYFSTEANQVWYERVSGVGAAPSKIFVYHYGGGYYIDEYQGRMVVEVYSSSSSHREYWTSSDATSTVAGILPTTFVTSAMSFVSLDSRIPIQQWCLETFKLK